MSSLFGQAISDIWGKSTRRRKRRQAAEEDAESDEERGGARKRARGGAKKLPAEVAALLGEAHAEVIGGDEERVLATGESYVSRGVGTLGPSLRGFVPIAGDAGEAVGFVAVGYLIEDVNRTIVRHQLQPRVFVFMMALVGLLYKSAMAANLKRSQAEEASGRGFSASAISKKAARKGKKIDGMEDGWVDMEEDADDDD